MDHGMDRARKMPPEVALSRETAVCCGTAYRSALENAGATYLPTCMGGELSKRQGVLFHWWPFGSKRNDRLKYFNEISLHVVHV